jgi:hypothetical protein
MLDFTIIIMGVDLGVQLDSLWARERFQEGCKLGVLMGFASSGGRVVVKWIVGRRGSGIMWEIVGILRKVVRVMQEVVRGIRWGIMRGIGVGKMRGISHYEKERC